jgi:hypothetical protein
MYKYETVINIGDREIQLRFSFMTMRTLEQMGLKITDLQRRVENDYTGILIDAVIAGAKTADVDITEDDVIQWVDENGFLSPTVQNVLAMFLESLTNGVPVSKNVQAVQEKKAPQKRTK